MNTAAIYFALKHTHIALVLVSFLLFAWRGYLAIDSRYQVTRTRTLLIHGVDTLLLVCGVSLAVLLGLNPLATPWLLAKIVALVLYVVIATIAIKRGKTRRQRRVAWWLAMVVFAYMVMTAISKSPLLFIGT